MQLGLNPIFLSVFTAATGFSLAMSITSMTARPSFSYGLLGLGLIWLIRARISARAWGTDRASEITTAQMNDFMRTLLSQRKPAHNQFFYLRAYPRAG